MKSEKLVQLECNIDDSTPELLAYSAERILRAGALDVWTTPIIMKKGRSAVMLSVLTRPELAEPLSEILFQETSTTGIRQFTCLRRSLPRKIVSVETSYGKLMVKVICRNNEIITLSPEFESCRRAADKYQVPLQKVYETVREIGRKILVECPENTDY